MRRIVIILGFVFSLSGTIYSQGEKQVSGGIINGRAKYLPKPVLKDEERAACASGQITVEVLVGTDGKVSSAKAVSGNEILWPSAVEAAMKARFDTINDLPPIKVKGYLVSNFARPANCGEKPKSIVWACNCNAKPISLPPPKYPEAALAVGVSGSVDVQIMVDKKGGVISAKALSGHPFLCRESERAALLAVFEPVLIGGRPRKVAGTIRYNFIR